MDKVSPRLAKKKILLVDDQSSIRSVYKLVLQDLGFLNIDSATDGLDAVNFLKMKPYDLVICDWNMPKMSGLDVLHILRECEETKTLPFMMVTSASEVDSVKKALGSGVSDYLIKPFQPSAFSDKARDLLRSSQHIAAKLVLQLDNQDEEKSIEEDSTESTVELGKKD